MESIPTYIANRHNPGNVKYKTPQLEHILDVTNGCIVYQEQVMQICRELAGFSYGQADLVRRAMSKKKHDVMEKERQHFVHGNTEPGHECAGCVANGISKQWPMPFLTICPALHPMLSIKRMRRPMRWWHTKPLI